MEISNVRRALLGAMVAASLVSGHALAQVWPSRAVRMVVPLGAGSAPDVVARILAERLGQMWGQGVVVDNRPGAGGIPGMVNLSRSPNDGYTIGFVPAAMAAITPLVYKDPQFNIDSDLQPVAVVGTSPLLLVTLASNGIKSLGDLAKAAKANPGKLNFAAPQTNSLPHLAGEMVSKVGRLNLFTVPYANPPAAVVGVLAGDAAVTVDGLPSLVQHVKSGKLAPLAVTSKERLPGFPDIPAVSETYPNYEPIVGWFVIFAPAGTPAAVLERVNRDVNTVLHREDVIAQLADLGIYPRTGDIAAARSFVADQRTLMKNVISELGLQPQ